MKQFTAALLAACFCIGVARADDNPLARYDDHSTTGMTRVAGPNYANENYGYAIIIPTGQTGWMNSPPAPNHGIRIFLGPQRSIEVDASFDSALLGSTTAVADDAVSSWPSKDATKHQTAMGGQPAEQVTVTGPGNRRRVVIVQWAGQGQDDAIVFTVSLETNSRDAVKDEHTFDAVLKSFKRVPRVS